MVLEREKFVWVAELADLKDKGSITVHPNGKPVALFLYGDRVYAVDNRCPQYGISA